LTAEWPFRVRNDMAWPPNKPRASKVPSMIRHEWSSETSGKGNGLGVGFQADLARTSSITHRRITESLKMDFVPPMSLIHLSPSAPRRPIARSHTEHLSPARCANTKHHPRPCPRFHHSQSQTNSAATAAWKKLGLHTWVIVNAS
jgi:hypothetical protein